ncbi:DUF1294 domain-containing protein [Gracilibacillus kekensis]|uniref:Uncharacterized membrane protein YsdA, DUF1294 family n=1 Tax=Gracilibacillus kekensis TaxID=1027249 RepID=A0A1M7NRC1_9BACI|nr:DUF1294 domain-containing protein [Gracilibacillus kekensis]SHN06434.1 Uncharacterized membrane protein YsdA, DUF1294 family [Gracilibacillus kekensis]
MEIYLLIINSIAFLIMGIDKHKARHNKWRIPERRIWMIAVGGGALGAMIGMYLFRHKTKHKNFLIILPVLVIIETTLLFFLYY